MLQGGSKTVSAGRSKTPPCKVETRAACNFDRKSLSILTIAFPCSIFAQNICAKLHDWRGKVKTVMFWLLWQDKAERLGVSSG
jgi:hypothetical protein